MFANRLWNDMAIYSAGLELGAKTFSPSCLQNSPLTRRLYELWAQFVGRVLHAKESMFAWSGTVRYLPPTTPLPAKYDGVHSLYLLGMLFRNPVGFETYQLELRKHFRAHKKLGEYLDSLLRPFQNRVLIGVEVRQQPFTYFPDGEFLIPLSRTKEILSEYMREHSLTPAGVTLVVATDLKLQESEFEGYNAIILANDEERSFYALTRCSVVLGTNSPHANLSAWLANVPHVVIKEESIDWDYYRNREKFFENKYATLTQKVTLH